MGGRGVILGKGVGTSSGRINDGLLTNGSNGEVWGKTSNNGCRRSVCNTDD